MTNSKALLLAAIAFSFLCSACASRPELDEEHLASNQPAPQVEELEEENWDPLEGINREIYDFNMNVLDKHIYRPVTVFYVDYVPEPAREGIDNFIRNLDEPSSAVNNLLQGNWNDSAKNVGRFVVNSTVGVAGVIDVASYLGMQRKLDTFGEVLGKYGVGDGPYLMLPVVGPSSVREEVGDYVDDLYWPLATLSFWPRVAQWAFKGLDARSRLIEQERLLENSLDPYLFVREAYFQNQEFQVYDGKVPQKQEPANEDYLDDYLDELE